MEHEERVRTERQKDGRRRSEGRRRKAEGGRQKIFYFLFAIFYLLFVSDRDIGEPWSAAPQIENRK